MKLVSIISLVAFLWTSNTEPELAGYNLYSGPAPGIYTNQVFVEPLIGPLLPGQDRTVHAALPPAPGPSFYTVRAVSVAGLESPPAPELSLTNNLRITFVLRCAGDLSGPRQDLTNQIWIARSSSNVFFFTELKIDVIP